jgi:hypothetical protein
MMPGYATRVDDHSPRTNRTTKWNAAAPTARHPGHIAWAVLLPVLVALLSHRAAAQGSTTTPAGAGTAPAAAPSPLPTTAPAAAHPFDGISLTTEQQTALKRATAQTQAARAAILRRQAQGGQLSREDRDALKTLGERHNALVQSLLSAPQRARLAANVTAERARRERERRGARSHTATPRVPKP